MCADRKVIGKVSGDRAEGVKMRGNAAFMREGQATWKVTYGWIYLAGLYEEGTLDTRQVSQRCWAVTLASEGRHDSFVAFWVVYALFSLLSRHSSIGNRAISCELRAVAHS